MNAKVRLILFLAVAAVAFGVAIVAGLTSDFLDAERSVQPDAASVSALGHHVFIDWIRALGHPTIVARALSTRRAAAEQPLLMLEPRADWQYVLHATEIRNRTAPTLLVLPKREGRPDEVDDRWVGAVSDVSPTQISKLLEACGIHGTIVRSKETDPVETVETGVYGDVSLDIKGVQVLAESSLEPLIETKNGVLLGRTNDNRPIYVLTEPDLIENHGIGGLRRTDFLRSLILELAIPGEPIVIDETIHGSGVERGFWREMIKMPLLPITLGVLLSVVVVWLGSRRFGRPAKSKPAIGFGKRALIDSTAELQNDLAMPHAMLRRYRAIVEHDVGRALGLPDRTDEASRHAILVRRTRAREMEFDLDRWLEAFEDTRIKWRSDERRVLDAIAELRRWQKEITSGPSLDR